MFWSVYVSQGDYFGMLALSKWEMSKQINCLIHIGSWQIDLEILFSPIRCWGWDGLFHIFYIGFEAFDSCYWEWKGNLAVLGGIWQNGLKKVFITLFLNWYFMSPLYRVMVTSTFYAGKNTLSIFSHSHCLPFFIISFCL